MQPETIHLSTFEIIHAAQAGVTRTAVNLARGREREGGRTDLGFGRDVLGVLGEYAVARALDLCWQPVVGSLDTHTGDVAGVQVKSTTRTDGSLIVRPHDPPEFPYVLAVVRRSTGGLSVDLAGWLDGAEAKVDRYWRAADPASGIHRAAYFAPQGALRPLDELRRSMSLA